MALRADPRGHNYDPTSVQAVTSTVTAQGNTANTAAARANAAADRLEAIEGSILYAVAADDVSVTLAVGAALVAGTGVTAEGYDTVTLMLPSI